MNDPLILLLIIAIPLLSQYVSSTMRSRFVQFSREPMPLSGAEAAQMMLQQHGIQDVRITAVRGQLTDHYNPADKTVNLSEVVAHERNLAAIAVATHEVGHAVQHATGYHFLQLRSKMVPLLKLSSLALPVLALGGAGISEMAGNRGVAVLCLFALGLPALFSVITLPVEFDASKRALRWLQESGVTRAEDHQGARKALFWAAMTYVVAALGSIIQALAFTRYFLKRR
jgi:uncharacterized protein